MPNSPSSDPDDSAQNESQQNTDLQPSMTIHPLPYSGMPMHMYPFPPGMVPSQPTRSKRRQVKNACTNCQKACKKCDDARPCLRCVKYGIAEECVDSHRKERKKGIKRGPYKKRDGKSFSMEPQYEGPSQQPIPMTAAIPGASSPMPFVGPVGFPPGFYGQYPSPPQKPGDPPIYYPQFYIAPLPAPPPHGSADGEGGYAHPQFYPATFLAPYAQPYAPYMMPHARPDGQMAMPPPGAHFTYPPIYPRPPSGSHEGGLERRDNRGDDNSSNH